MLYEAQRSLGHTAELRLHMRAQPTSEYYSIQLVHVPLKSDQHWARAMGASLDTLRNCTPGASRMGTSDNHYRYYIRMQRLSNLFHIQLALGFL